MKNENSTPRKYQRYDATFKRSAVEHWLSSGKAADAFARPNLPATITAPTLSISESTRSGIARSPELARVIDPLADVAKQPVTPTEKFFVQMVLSNTSSMYEMLKDELVTKQEGLRLDIKSFFSLPVPKAVWNKSKLLQNQDFAAFVESALKN